MKRDLTSQSIAVVGYGITGQSCVRFLLSQRATICVIDTDPAIASKLEINENVSTLQFTSDIDLSNFSIVVISPGVNPHQPCFERYLERGGELIGDIELFSWFNYTPLIGITGSNGKTTVTDMLGQVLRDAGLKIELAGNYGKCALDVLMDHPNVNNSTDKYSLDFIVLELSSYQLEMTNSLQLDIATILNITEDHLDRHGSFELYKKAKQGIFNMANKVIVCRDEPESYPPQDQFSAICANVGSDSCKMGYGIQKDSNNPDVCISFDSKAVMLVSDLGLKGIHNQVNAMTVLAICDQLKLERKLTVPSIIAYSGLPHRFELVKESQLIGHKQGPVLKTVRWINDSKATNIGACKAALTCFSNTNEYVILIAGGDAKGVNLFPLVKPIKERVNQLIVMGKDAHKFIELFPKARLVVTLQEAITLALEILDSANFMNATVLLSPACASVDMFKNYQHRGDAFIQAVNEQVAS
jgi:UDP-N-acetylmuramoylalanine--D-glutamate ligase